MTYSTQKHLDFAGATARVAPTNRAFGSRRGAASTELWCRFCTGVPCGCPHSLNKGAILSA
jgi:hypothetical protein